MKNQYKHHFLLKKQNYLIMIVGCCIMALGYIMMIGGGASNPMEYPVDTLYGFRNTVLAPMLVLLGLATQVVAIFWGGKQAKADHKEEDLLASTIDRDKA